MACICQGCWRPYTVDVMIPDADWRQIQPRDKPLYGGLLCGGCIFLRLECLHKYAAYKAVPV